MTNRLILLHMLWNGSRQECGRVAWDCWSITGKCMKRMMGDSWISNVYGASLVRLKTGPEDFTKDVDLLYGRVRLLVYLAYPNHPRNEMLHGNWRSEHIVVFDWRFWNSGSDSITWQVRRIASLAKRRKIMTTLTLSVSPLRQRMLDEMGCANYPPIHRFGISTQCGYSQHISSDSRHSDSRRVTALSVIHDRSGHLGGIDQ